MLKMIAFILINFIMVELISLLFYILTSKKAYKNEGYWIYVSKNMLIVIPILIGLNILLGQVLNLEFNGFYTLVMIILIPWIVIEPIVLDFFFGDIVYDYYEKTGNRNLFKMKEYFKMPNTLYTVKRTLLRFGIRAKSISLPLDIDEEENNLYYVNKRYYVLLSPDREKLISKLDEKEVVNRYIEELKKLSGFKAINDKQSVPFCTYMYCDFLNNKDCTLEITIYEEDMRICVTSNRTITTKN